MIDSCTGSCKTIDIACIVGIIGLDIYGIVGDSSSPVDVVGVLAFYGQHMYSASFIEQLYQNVYLM
jgi:hypothetical protein